MRFATLGPPGRDKRDVTGLLRWLLAAKELSITTFGSEGQWREVERPQDALYEDMVREGELQLEDGPGGNTQLTCGGMA